jgi:hypothetical protein
MKTNLISTLALSIALNVGCGSIMGSDRRQGAAGRTT